MVLQQRTQEIREHFAHKDFDLAYSTLLDCVLDSENLALFERIIANEHWKEQHPEHTSEDWLQKCEAIVDALEELNLPEKRRNESLLNCDGLVKTYARGNFKLGPVSFNIRPGQLKLPRA
jgi:ABC-2 type transport system ATP-binding protein